MAVDEKAEQNRTMLEHTNLFADDETRQPLDECKIQVHWGIKTRPVKFFFKYFGIRIPD